MYYSYQQSPETYNLGFASAQTSSPQYPQTYTTFSPTNYQNLENIEKTQNINYNNYYNSQNYTQTENNYAQYFTSQPENSYQNYSYQQNNLNQNYSYQQNNLYQNNYTNSQNFITPQQKIEEVPDIPMPIFSINQNYNQNNNQKNINTSFNQNITKNESLFPETTKSVYLSQVPTLENKLKSVPPEKKSINDKEKSIIKKSVTETKLKNFNKEYDINSNYEIKISKEPNFFKFLNIKKIAKPLLAHMELPENYEYKSPNLSPNGLYLSCIAKGNSNDIVYIWDISELYYYKYKYDSSKVDSVTFTPDSDKIIIIYKNKSPIMYSLINGKKILEFQNNGEENNRNGYNFAFTVMGNHFGYASDKSFTLWSLRTGSIKLQIFDNSAIKIICHNYLVCINDELNVKILKISNEEILIEFKLKGIENINEILDAKCSDDMESFIYVIKQGIIRYVFKDKEYKGVQKFTSGVEKAIISDDSKLVVKTNMRNINIYDIEKQQTIISILKEKFKEFRIDFLNKKLLIIDNISINIQDYKNENKPEKYVWLNKNPKNFIDTKFSKDFSILLARVDKNNAIIYNLETGKIIKKYQNIDDNWLDFAITSKNGNKIAIKTDLFLIKIYDYKIQRDKGVFYGFDSYSLNFSSSGKYLACGTKKGPEIARIWDIEKNSFGSFPYLGENSNLNTIVHLTNPDPNKLICCSVLQQPLIFDSNTKELLYKCECLYKLEEIFDIISDQKCDIFLVKGRDVRKRNIGLLYRISDGNLLEVFENYKILELSDILGIVISKCDNINKGQLTSSDYKNLSDPIINTFEIQSERSNLLNDKKTLVSLTGKNDNEMEYLLSDIENGGFIGKISFMKKSNRNSQQFLTVDTDSNELVFRFYELLSPEETKAYKKKKIFW